MIGDLGWWLPWRWVVVVGLRGDWAAKVEGGSGWWWCLIVVGMSGGGAAERKGEKDRERKIERERGREIYIRDK